MADRIGFDRDGCARALAVLPLPDLQATGDDDSLPFRDGRGDIDSELAESRDGVPIGFSVDPPLCRSIKPTLRLGEPEGRDRQPLARDDVAWSCGDESRESDAVGHEVLHRDECGVDRDPANVRAGTWPGPDESSVGSPAGSGSGLLAMCCDRTATTAVKERLAQVGGCPGSDHRGPTRSRRSQTECVSPRPFAHPGWRQQNRARVITRAELPHIFPGWFRSQRRVRPPRFGSGPLGAVAPHHIHPGPRRLGE